MSAFIEWWERGFEGEPPDGWIRAAPPYFRRRPDGDPDTEYVER